jgi:hypothetical protein
MFIRRLSSVLLIIACATGNVVFNAAEANAIPRLGINIRGEAPAKTAVAKVVSVCASYQSWCNSSLASATYPTYGNDPIAGIGNCTFAAVANWLEITTGIRPSADQIGIDFVKAGGKSNLGFSNQQVLEYWKVSGIAGTFLESAQGYVPDANNLKLALDDVKIGVVIAQIRFVAGQYFAGYHFSSNSFHWLVIDGYTSTGPVVVTWGKTIQMTWDQWEKQALAIWGITTKQ